MTHCHLFFKNISKPGEGPSFKWKKDSRVASFSRDSNSGHKSQQPLTSRVEEDLSQADDGAADQLFDGGLDDDVTDPDPVGSFDRLPEGGEPGLAKNAAVFDQINGVSAVVDPPYLPDDAETTEELPYLKPEQKVYFEGRNIALIKNEDLRPDLFYAVLNDESSSSEFSAMPGEMADHFRSSADLPEHRDDESALTVGSFVAVKVGPNVSKFF